MENQLQTTRSGQRRWSLEPFEWVGLVASLAALVVFLAWGPALDAEMGKPGYHWNVVGMIAGIYARFIPEMLGLCVLVFLAARWVLRRRQLDVRPYLFAVRAFLSYCVLLIVFRVVNYYVPVLHPGLRDSVIQRMDAWLFGGRQVADWLEPLVTPWLTDLLTGAYVLWFWMLFATILVLALKDRRIASEYVLASLLCFYIGYVGYVLVPVVGPGYTWHFSVHVGGIAAQYTADRLLLPRDCFPSLHTAISVLMVIYIARHRPNWLVLYAPIAVLIVFATLYLRFHYGSDDITGAAMAWVVAQAAPLLQRWLSASVDRRGDVRRSA